MLENRSAPAYCMLGTLTASVVTPQFFQCGDGAAQGGFHLRIRVIVVVVGRDALVKRLRRKLGGDARNSRYIMSQPRVGYRTARGDNAGT